MARTVEDVALLLDILSYSDSAEQPSLHHKLDRVHHTLERNVAGLRVGIPENWFFDICADDVLQATEAVIDELVAQGAIRVRVSLSTAHLAAPISWAIIHAELAALHRSHAGRLAELGTAWTQQTLVDSQFVSAIDYLQALRAIHVLQHDLQHAFEVADVLVVPTAVAAAPRHDGLTFLVNDEEHDWDEVVARNTTFFSLVGVPALAIPSGLSEARLPLSVQIAARPGRDDLCLSVGHALQRVLGFHALTPQL
jgi:aspartyl-tRNA(Asn)/glutamyl-tRNA(Gln) amidotransferase subunit A